MNRRPHLLAAAGAALLAACGRASTPAPDVGAADRRAADSVVVERLPGFTRAPGHRVSVARSGRVAFAWLAPGDSARPAADSVAPARAAALLASGPEAGVGRLPERIREHPELCGPMATDHGTAVVTLFYPDGPAARVEDYLGCRDAPPALRGYEALVDSVAGTARWTARRDPS